MLYRLTENIHIITNIGRAFKAPTLQERYFKGVAQFDQENYNAAIETLIRVRSLYASYDEWYSKSLMKLGDTYVEIGDKKSASEMYKGVLKKHPRDLMGKEAKEKLKSL